jgi:hypothetical protein
MAFDEARNTHMEGTFSPARRENIRYTREVKTSQ